MNRLGEPEEIAAAISFLISREAPYISGTTLTVDGAMSSVLMLPAADPDAVRSSTGREVISRASTKHRTTICVEFRRCCRVLRDSGTVRVGRHHGGGLDGLGAKPRATNGDF